MNTHRRAWVLRAGVVAALVAGTVTGATLPAQAAQPGAQPAVQIVSLSSATLNAGDRAALRFAIQNNNNEAPGQPDADTATVRIRTDFGELRCDGRCDFDEQIPRGEARQFEVNLVAGNVEPGQTKSGRVRIEATINGQTGATERGVSVRGAQEAPTVKRVSGQIVDVATGDPVADAAIAMRDSEDNNFSAETNDNGRFSITGDAQNPIAPGRIDIAVGKTGYADITKTFTVRAGQSKTDIKISLTSTASPTASPSAGASAAPSAEASQPPAALDNASEESDSGLSTIFIILGGLLVALGVGAIVLLLVRRKQEKDDEAAEGLPATAGGPRGAVPPSRGAYHGAGDDATRVVSGAGMGADPTMMGRPGLADAPTMLQAPVRDEYADPYGLPPGVTPAGPPTQAYGAGPQPGWGGGYGDATQVGGYPGAAGSPAGYGPPGPGGSPAGFGPGGRPAPYGSPVAPRGGYPDAPADPYSGPPGPRSGYGGPGYEGAPGRGPADGFGGRDFAEPGPDRYDETTGRFNGAGAPAGGYGPPGGRFDDGPPADYRPGPPAYEGGYGRPTSGGPNGAYGGPTSGGPSGGYGGPPAGPPPGYDDRAGYDQRGGYEGGGYGGAPAGPPPGYDDRAGYDQRGPGYGAPSGGGYPDQRGYEPPPAGYEGPAQRGGYDPRDPRAEGYDQGGYYPEQGAPPSRHSTPQPPPARGERRSLDWLDD